MNRLDNARRLAYLTTMGITAWLPRNVVQTERNAQEPVLVIHESPIPLSTATEEGWAKLEAEVAVCSRCGLCKTRNNTVFGTGNRQASWLLIGEGPGQHEDEQGKQFVGHAGQLLTEMIRAMGLVRDEVFITNVIKCRQPNNRDPHQEEVTACHSFLQRQVDLIKPSIILAVGRVAAQTLLDTDAPLSRLRGKVHYFGQTPLIVVYHPAYLLRSLLEKRKAWQDLLFARKVARDLL